MPLAWELLQQVFTVATIMTPAADLQTWPDGDLAGAREAPHLRRFDLIPLVVAGGRIAGVYNQKAKQREDLTDRWLVSRDTPIPDLLDLFAATWQPGFLVLYRQEVAGIVTPADLNKMPARVYLYNLIGELETALAGLVRVHIGADQGGIVPLLSDRRKDELTETIERQEAGDVAVDMVTLLNLSDLVKIVQTTGELRSRLGFTSKKKAEKALGGLVDMRNQVMHLVRPVLERAEDVGALAERVRRAREALQRLDGQEMA